MLHFLAWTLWTVIIGHTLTRISQCAAVLYGSAMQLGRRDVGYCWIMDLDEALSLEGHSSVWTPIPKYEQSPRFLHAPVLDPLSQQLWIIGGCLQDDEPTTASGIQKLAVKVVPLKVLAMECTVCHVSANDPRLRNEELPENLRREIKVNRSNM